MITQVLSRVSLGTLLEVAWDSTGSQLLHRAMHHGVLDVITKAMLVDACQKRGLYAQVRRQRIVRDIFLRTSGDELTKLKNLVDFGGDTYNLDLLMSNMTNKRLRKEIIKHIAAEASKVRADHNGRAVGIKVLSDVDDTLYSSGGKWPAGCDKTYPRHVVYPGCLKLYQILDKSWDDESCNLIFLSARPHVYKSLAEDSSYRLFGSLVKEGRMHTVPTLLPGSLFRGGLAMLTYGCLKTKAWRWVGHAKYEKFLFFTSLFS